MLLPSFLMSAGWAIRLQKLLEGSVILDAELVVRMLLLCYCYRDSPSPVSLPSPLPSAALLMGRDLDKRPRSHHSCVARAVVGRGLQLWGEALWVCIAGCAGTTAFIP